MLEREVISQRYPNLILPPTPLTFDNESNYLMQPEERAFAVYLIDRGLSVYREPQIEGLGIYPDFFVCNPNTNAGKIVEITFADRGFSQCSRNSRQRKFRQMKALENCGIPYVILFREELLRMNYYSDGELFKGFAVN